MAERNLGEKQFSTFSGADIRAVFGSEEIGELQAISYAIQREKAPIYVMGHKDPRAFSRGKRGIAGTLVFIHFDSPALIEAFGYVNPTTNVRFLTARDEARPSFGDDGESVFGPNPDVPPDVVDEDGTVDFDIGYSLEKPWYLDQIPPFDVTVIGANEYGATSSMCIIGVELLNEGVGISVDDIVLEQQTTYVCRGVQPFRRTRKWQLNYAGANSTVEEV